MRDLARRIALGAAVLAAALAAPAGAQTDGLPETFTVGPNATGSGTAVLESGVEYRLVVSGTMDLRFAQDASTTRVMSLDPFYCYKDTAPGGCSGSANDGASPIQMRSSGDAAGHGYQLPFFISPRGFEPPFAASHEYDVVMVPYKDGTIAGSTKSICSYDPRYSCTGPGYTFRVSDLCPAPKTADAAAINEVRVVAVTPSVAFHRGGGPDDKWCELEKDDVLKQGDEISADPDGSVTLAFADNSTVVVKNTTQLTIASFFTEGGVVRTEILLKMGEVAAKVNKSEATKSDFTIKSPTAAASTRGTTFRAFFDPGSKAMVTSTTEGVVEVDPARAGRKDVLVKAGREVEVTPAATSKVTKIGNADARGGDNRVDARKRVLAKIARANDPCGVTTPRTNAYSIKPAPGGWKVAVKVTGKLDGTSEWTVKRGVVHPVDALARRLAKGC